LGVTIGSSSTAPTQAASQPAALAATPATPAAAAAPAVSAGSVPAAQMVDYSQRYNENVLGQKPVNVGNVILIVMILGMLLGGGYFVVRREGLVSISFQDTKQIQATKTVQEGFPADVVEMVPDLAKLKPDARRNLREILAKPGTAGELFASIVKLIKPEDAATDAKEEE
jgi:predicted methyltransferase